MSRQRRLGACTTLLALLVALSCATSPSAPEGQSVSPSPPGPAAESAGTAIRTAEPTELAKARDERAAIESAIVFGSPSTLAKAAELAAASATLKPDEALAYRSLAEGVSGIVYPERGTQAEPGPAELGLKPGPPLAAALSLLDEARAGRVKEVPPEAAGNSLAELLPSLAIFASDSRDVATRAGDAIGRFAALGSASILPDLALGFDAERQRDYPSALGHYAAALAAAEDSWRASLGSGRVLVALGRPEEALAFLEPLAPRLSGSLAFDRPYAAALVENGRYDEAAPLVAEVLTADPQDSALVLIRARLLVKAKSYQQALPLLDAYGTVDPSNRRLLILRSRAAEGLKNRDDALRWARRGLTSYPDDPELLVAAARLLYAGSGPGRDEARDYAARAAEGLGKAEASGSPAELAERLAARVEAARLLASDAASRYDWKAAAGYLQAVQAVASFDDKALAATILRRSGSFPEALDYVAEWYRLEPASEAATEAYLRALVDSGDAKSAQELIARLLPGNHTGQFRSTLYYLQSGFQKSDDAALQLLRSALMENAGNREALAALSDLQARRKDYAKARFYLKQALALAPGDPELLRRQSELDKAGQ